MSSGFWYVATIYTVDTNELTEYERELVLENRFDKSSRAAGWLMNNEVVPFSPIVHCHPIAQRRDLPKTWDWWEMIDRTYLESSEGLIVVCDLGWEWSVGVQAEIKIAKELNLPIRYLLPTVDPNVYKWKE